MSRTKTLTQDTNLFSLKFWISGHLQNLAFKIPLNDQEGAESSKKFGILVRPFI